MRASSAMGYPAQTQASRQHKNRHSVRVQEPYETFAFGIRLRLTTTDEGGRRTPLAGGSDASVQFQYRPNWGLPDMTPPDQTGAPVLAFSREHILPGEEVRAVIVPIFPAMVPAWSHVQVGDTLPMYEGPRVCGRGLILWRRKIMLPSPEGGVAAFLAWVQGAEDAPEPPT
jgi:hypothetical protein